MKKTTYILFAFIGISIVWAFFFPAMAFKPVDLKPVTLTPVGETMTESLGTFQVLDITNIYMLGFTRPGDDGRSHSPRVRIIEDSSVDSPVLMADKAWEGNLTLQEINDENSPHLTILQIDLDVSRLSSQLEKREKQHPGDWVILNTPDAFELRVPRGMLGKIRAYGVTLSIENFDGGSMDLDSSRDPFTLLNCSFADLTVR